MSKDPSADSPSVRTDTEIIETDVLAFGGIACDELALRKLVGYQHALLERLRPTSATRMLDAKEEALQRRSQKTERRAVISVDPDSSCMELRFDTITRDTERGEMAFHPSHTQGSVTLPSPVGNFTYLPGGSHPHGNDLVGQPGRLVMYRDDHETVHVEPLPCMRPHTREEAAKDNEQALCVEDFIVIDEEAEATPTIPPEEIDLLSARYDVIRQERRGSLPP